MAKSIVKYTLLFLVSTIITLLIVAMAGYYFGHSWKFVANCIYGFSILFFIKKYFKQNARLAYFIAVLPSLIIIVILFFAYVKDPDSIFILAIYSTLSFLLGVLLSFIAVRIQKKWLVIVPMLILNFWFVFYGSELLLHKTNYETYFGEQNINVVNVRFLDKNNDTIVLNNPDKYYVLDFWTTTCGVCFQEFPKVEKLYNKYKGSEVEFYSINFPLRGQNYETAEKMIRSRDYTFPILQFEDEDREWLGKKYSVFAFPTVLIIKNGKIIHVGNIDSAKRRLKKLVKN